MRARHTPAPTIMPAAMREPDAATYIGTTISFLRAARVGRCEGPPYLRAGRMVLYRRADLDAWLEARLVGRQRQAAR